MYEAKWSEEVPHLVFARVRERTWIWIARNELFVERLNEVSARPLEEQFRDQHPVRLASFPPRERAPVRVEPGARPAAQPASVLLVDMVRALSGLTATHRRILAYLKEHVGEDVPGNEIARVAGIHEWARRVRELRVEHGYKITPVKKGQNSVYRLESLKPDVEGADRWRSMNKIRRDPEHGAKARILAFFKANVEKPVNMDELRYVANIHEVGRRVRELRVEQGYVITSHMDRTDLEPGEYVLETLEPLPPHERLTAEQRTRILERDGYRCVKCGWGVGDPPTHGKRFVEVHHKIAVQDGGGSDDANLETLCNACHDAIPV
jgi:HNH endonuclease